MACFQGSLWSEMMEMETNLSIIIPDTSIRTGKKAKVLYLLHGYGGNATSWLRFSNIELLAARYNLAVVMPEAGYSYYQDMELGKKYFTFLTEELPKYMKNLFPISTEREDNYVIGNSMGGYGALKCVLACPERYAAGAGLAALPDIHWNLNPVLYNYNEEEGPYAGYEERVREAAAIFGCEPKIKDEQDLYILGKKAAESDYNPKVISICGLSDKLLEENKKLANYLETLSLDFSFLMIEGIHDGEFSQRALEIALQIILDNKNTK